MADLVAEVAEQRAIRLFHGVPDGFARGVVGLGDVEGDDAVVVAGKNFGSAAVRIYKIGKETKGEAALRIFFLIGDRKVEPDQAVNEPALGAFDECP